MIIGELFTGGWILLEKGPSRYHISEDQRSPEQIQKTLYLQIRAWAKRGAGGGLPVAHTMWWRGTPLAGATRWCGGPGPPTGLPLRILVHPENLRRGRSHREVFRRRHEAETREREKTLRQGEICRGNSLPEGEDRRHRHRHRARLHRDHHHHLHHWAPSSPSRHSVPL